jgi:hypothetical protein
MTMAGYKPLLVWLSLGQFCNVRNILVDVEIDLESLFSQRHSLKGSIRSVNYQLERGMVELTRTKFNNDTSSSEILETLLLE